MAETTIIDLREDIDAGELRRVLIPPKLPRSERHRTVYGRSVDLGRIQSALLQADGGNMVELTDLESEMMSLDPHLSAILRKRVGSIQCLPWRIDPATGEGVDPELAEEIANVVRQHILAIPRFTERLVDLAWATFYNRAALEIHWTIQPGKIRWRPKSLEWVHPRRLAFGPERELRLINTFRRRGDFVEQGFALRDFPGKFITWQPRLFGEYPEREGLGPRVLYWAFFKRFSWRMRMALTELYGVPWRIVETDKDAPVNKDAIDAAFDAAEKLGETTSAAFGKGMKLNIPNLGDHRAELFGMNSEEINGEQSKLVLGQTGTTDSTGNRAETIVQKGEQDIIVSSDALGVEGSIQRDLVAPDVVLNYGLEAISHCPRFVLDATPPRDAAKEQERIKSVVMLGVPVAVTEIREVGGVREPADDEAFVVAKSPGTDATGNPLPAVPILVDPNEPPPEPPATPPASPLVPPEAPPGLPETPDDELAAAGGLEDGGVARQEELAEEAAKGLARSFGIPLDSARLAHAACRTGDYAALKAVPGLGLDDQATLVELYFAPKPVVVSRAVAVAAGLLALDAVASSIEGNHGHSLRIADEVIDAKSGAAFSIQGAADHDHRIELSSEDMQVLFDGGQVVVLSTDGGRGEHNHNVTIDREGANVDDPEDIDGAIDEFGRHPKKKKPHTYEGEPGSEEPPGPPLPGEPFRLQAVGPFGSPEDIVERGAKVGGAVIARIIEKLTKAIESSGLRGGVRALEEASQKLDVDEFAAAVEETALRSSMLGALDADEEPKRGRPVPIERFAERDHDWDELRLRRMYDDWDDYVDPKLLERTPFTQKTFQDAIDFFNSRKVVTPEVFEAMADEAKTRAFTVAGAATEDVVRVVRDELRASLTAGVDLRTFKRQLQERLELGGWLKRGPTTEVPTVPGRPWHVETIYRNGVQGSYSRGRQKQMLQPAVLAARPFWQIRTVKDNRQRPTHGAAHMKIIPADSSFWTTSGAPPWGHNCRCRFVSLSPEQAKGETISDGSELTLPDPGWSPNVILA